MPLEPPADSNEFPPLPEPVIPDSRGLSEAAEIAKAAEIEISSPSTPENSAAAASEENKIEADQRELIALEKLRLENTSLSTDIKARDTYAQRIFRLILWWLAAIFTILLLQGFLSKRGIALEFLAGESLWKTEIHFELDDSVLLALIGGTTASVIGLFAIVANYFFPKKP